MWCPKCNKEYDEGFTLCMACGSKLVDYKPILSPEDEQAVLFDPEDTDVPDAAAEQSGEAEDSPAFNHDAFVLDASPKLLITVIGEDEAARVMQLLEDNLIPSLKKDSEEVLAQPEQDFEADFGEEIPLPDDSFPADGETDEFSAFCDETLPTEEPLFDLFVPEAMYRDAFRLIVEDEQAAKEAEQTDHPGDISARDDDMEESVDENADTPETETEPEEAEDIVPDLSDLPTVPTEPLDEQVDSPAAESILDSAESKHAAQHAKSGLFGSLFGHNKKD